MKRNEKKKLSRREFGGALAAVLGAPAFVNAGPAAAQEEKKEPPKTEAQPKAAAPPEEEDFGERARKALRGFAVPAETEPAFVFRARRK